MWSGIVVENWAHSVGQCWLQFSVHPLNLLGVLLTCNGFTWIQKAVMDQMSSRPPNSDHDFFFGACMTLGSALELLLRPVQPLSWSLPFLCKIHLSSHITIRSRSGSLLLHRIRQDYTSKLLSKKFWSAHEASAYLASLLFQFGTSAE